MHRFPHLGILLLVWLTMSGAGADSVGSGIYRCVGEDNVLIFTDRACSMLGAQERKAETDRPAAFALQFPSQDCSRRIDTLQTRIRLALESGDVNQLAGLYHWLDATIHTVDILMPELQVISGRPLNSIEIESYDFDGVEYPIRLWLDQHVPERPARTIRTGFSLIMNSGCWWLHGR
ncbi:MAG: hypothetical protein WD397_07325 [Wenzhouxiangellaceae bacterium]